MALKILGILGSPCLNGNSASLLEAVLEGAKEAGAETERLDLARMKIAPCRACRQCDTGIGCKTHQDDMNVIYKRIREVDGIVLSSPIFFMGVTAQTKAMIDRCQCFWFEKYVQGIRTYQGRRRPKGLFVSCAGSSKPIVFDPAVHIVKAFFAAIDYEYIGQVLLPNTDDPEVATNRMPAIEEARIAGGRLCQ